MDTDRLRVTGLEATGWTLFQIVRRLLLTFACGLGGHDMIRGFAPDRVFLRCTSCPYETAGWQLREAPAEARRRRRRVAFVVQGAR